MKSAIVCCHVRSLAELSIFPPHSPITTPASASAVGPTVTCPHCRIQIDRKLAGKSADSK